MNAFINVENELNRLDPRRQQINYSDGSRIFLISSLYLLSTSYWLFSDFSFFIKFLLVCLVARRVYWTESIDEDRSWFKHTDLRERYPVRNGELPMPIRRRLDAIDVAYRHPSHLMDVKSGSKISPFLTECMRRFIRIWSHHNELNVGSPRRVCEAGRRVCSAAGLLTWERFVCRVIYPIVVNELHP